MELEGHAREDEIYDNENNVVPDPNFFDDGNDNDNNNMWADDHNNDEYVYNDDDIAGAGFSFDNFGKQESLKTLKCLHKMDDKLFSAPPSQIDVVDTMKDSDTSANNAESVEENAFYSMRRYASGGYDAHSEAVSDQELLDWQRQFVYLRVVGTAIAIPEYAQTRNNNQHGEGHQPISEFIPSADNSSGSSIRMEVDPSSTSSEALGELAIVGKSVQTQPTVQLHNTHSNSNNAGEGGGDGEEEEEIEEEIICSHGELSEILVINHTPTSICPQPQVQDDLDNAFIDPKHVRCNDIAQAVLDREDCWPTFVNTALKPLIAAVVRAARVNNLQYNDDSQQQTSKPKNEWADDDDDW
jgi:hypothetical protein